MELLFSIYRPRDLGVIDYHGAHRQYTREQVGGINLDIDSSAQRLRQHALYNYANKYKNVKSEMAAAYVRELVGRDAGVDEPASTSLRSTLRELFQHFFPGKRFEGPVPGRDRSLSFPVTLEDGRQHDINDLSSGEKEVLFGYLRLRNTAPHNSVLLLDEPELHLNPRLVRGLPSFYHQHLGRKLNNQLWLVTHSDAFLREAVGQPGFSVFHMSDPAYTEDTANQVISVSA